MHMLDNRRNVIMRKFRVLLGKTTLYRIDLRPLFLRHARHHRQRTGFSLGITGFSRARRYRRICHTGDYGLGLDDLTPSLFEA